MKTLLRLAILFMLTACASAPKSPEWTRGSTRQVDNGFIVYVGQAEASNQERAQFKAEGLALEDLANECSLIPKGARVEDRYFDKQEHTVTAYVKLAVEMQDCDEARHANTPETIQKVASQPFTQQLKRYQDLSETGEMPEPGEGSEVTPPPEIASAPARDPRWSEDTHFYVVRQYVAYQKEIVVLAPPTAYAANTPAAQQFASNVQPASQQIVNSEEKNPALRQQAWSRLPEHPSLPRPAGLAVNRTRANHGIRPPAQPMPRSPGKVQKKKGGRGGKKRRHAD